MKKSILELSNEEAKKFFLREDSYFTFDLPKYFTFSDLLNKVDEKLGGEGISNFKEKNPCDFYNINYSIFHNKDGKYGWRRFELINPAIYVGLVNEITEINNRLNIIQKFNSFKKSNNIKCLSLPIVSFEGEKNKKVQIIQWWENFEQESIALSLDYSYLYKTDIVDCYGSIYTHSISRALHTKEIAKVKRKNKKLIGNMIDYYIQSMSNGQTNGIPQGSVLMDFIAEMVLGYVDSEITLKLKNEGIKKKQYKILRYRDDYRIFVNDTTIGEKIIKIISIVLSDIGMRISQEKTTFSNNVVKDSIKEDKLLFIQDYKHSKNIQKELLNLLVFSNKYKTSKQVNKYLQFLFNKVKKWDKTHQNLEVIIAILTDIAFNNPNTYPIIVALLTKFLGFLPTDKAREKILKKINNKFLKIPNTEHLNLWLQRASIGYNLGIEYEGILCKKVFDNSAQVWNTDWLNKELKEIINNTPVVNEEEIKKLSKVIDEKEIELFDKKQDIY